MTKRSQNKKWDRTEIKSYIKVFSLNGEQEQLNKLVAEAKTSTERWMIKKAWAMSQVQKAHASIKAMKNCRWAWTPERIEETAATALFNIQHYGHKIMTPRAMADVEAEIPTIARRVHKKSANYAMENLRTADAPYTVKQLQQKADAIKQHYLAHSYYPKTREATVAKYLSRAMEKARAHWMDRLQTADAASYSVKDINRIKGHIMMFNRALGRESDKDRTMVEKKYREACARCCRSRIQRITKAPFVYRLSTEDMSAEKAAIRTLYVRAQEETHIRNIETSLQRAEAICQRRGQERERKDPLSKNIIDFGQASQKVREKREEKKQPTTPTGGRNIKKEAACEVG